MEVVALIELNLNIKATELKRNQMMQDFVCGMLFPFLHKVLKNKS